MSSVLYISTTENVSSLFLYDTYFIRKHRPATSSCPQVSLLMTQKMDFHETSVRNVISHQHTSIPLS
jgi:hypothetical protein